jgi:hypothetical protein
MPVPLRGLHSKVDTVDLIIYTLNIVSCSFQAVMWVCSRRSHPADDLGKMQIFIIRLKYISVKV